MDQCDSLITKLITVLLDWYSGDIRAWLAFEPVLFARLKGQPKRKWHFILISSFLEEKINKRERKVAFDIDSLRISEMQNKHKCHHCTSLITWLLT